MSDPIRIDSRERVALDLALRISEDSDTTSQNRDEKYWLTLYSHCLSVVFHQNPDRVLRGE